MHADWLAGGISWFGDAGFLGKVLEEWGADTQEFIRMKLPHLLVVAAIAFILNRLLRLITRHMTRVAERHGAGAVHLAQTRTLAGVIQTTGRAVIGLITGLQVLAAVGFNLAPLLASAGVAGIAIGLAAQTIVKDMFNGVLILVEDQFNVGNTVRVAGVAGVVEAMTLRKTTVRDADGTLYVIPNSQIATVANLSAGYSVATVHVSVDISADPNRVQELLERIALEVRQSDEHRQVFTADPQVLGVDVVRGSEMIFAVLFRTLATKQFAPVREFRRRVRLELEKQKLLPGDPNRVFQPTAVTASRAGMDAEGTGGADPTRLKSQDGSPLSGG